VFWCDGLCHILAVGFIEAGGFISVGQCIKNLYGDRDDDVGTGWVFEIIGQCSLVYSGTHAQEFEFAKSYQS
jgi:hypothetical protein